MQRWSALGAVWVRAERSYSLVGQRRGEPRFSALRERELRERGQCPALPTLHKQWQSRIYRTVTVAKQIFFKVSDIGRVGNSWKITIAHISNFEILSDF